MFGELYDLWCIGEFDVYVLWFVLEELLVLCVVFVVVVDECV